MLAGDFRPVVVIRVQRADRLVVGLSGQPIFPIADISVSLSVLEISPPHAR